MMSLELREVDKPAIEDDEVLVLVHAASVHPDIWHALTGRPWIGAIGRFIRLLVVAPFGRQRKGSRPSKDPRAPLVVLKEPSRPERSPRSSTRPSH